MTATSPRLSQAVLFTRPGCPLCYVMEREARRAARRSGGALRIEDLPDDAALEARYGREIPVLEMPDGPILKGRVPAAAVDAAFRPLARSRRRPPGPERSSYRGALRRLIFALRWRWNAPR